MNIDDKGIKCFRMNEDERIAYNYLKSKEFDSIFFEPTGKKLMPDFSINGEIAVEVRRLNLSHERKGLEELRIPLGDKITNMLSEIKSENHKKSYFVSYHFKRPLSTNNKSIVVKEMKDLLEQFLRGSVVNINLPVLETNNHLWWYLAGTEIPTFVLKRNIHASLHVPKQARYFPEIFRFKLIPREERNSNAFSLGIYFDRDTVCRPVLETNSNLQSYIDEKTQKREDSRKKQHEELNKYKEWWLIFVDYINHGISQNDFEQLKEMWDYKHSWNKIILLNPDNCSDAKEIS